jgi:predicted amidophosphoribosyltransferase
MRSAFATTACKTLNRVVISRWNLQRPTRAGSRARVLVIDDVLITGVRPERCSEALLTASASALDPAAVARVR